MARRDKTMKPVLLCRFRDEIFEVRDHLLVRLDTKALFAQTPGPVELLNHCETLSAGAVESRFKGAPC